MTAKQAVDNVRSALGWARAGIVDAINATRGLPADQREAILAELATADAAVGRVVDLINAVGRK